MAVSNLNEGENSFRRLAENLPGIVYRVLIEDDNRTVFFNDMVQTMTGYSPKDLRKGKVCSIDPLILPEDRVNVLNIIKDAIENNVPFEVEYRINTKGGEVKWFFERGRPIRRKNGKPSYIDGVIFDITDRKESEKKLKTTEESLERLNKELKQRLYEGKIGLRESENKFKSVYDDSPIGIELYDSNGKLVDMNKSCLDIFGISRVADIANFDLFNDPNVPKEQLKKLKKGQIIRLEILFDFNLVKDLNLYETTKSGKIWIDILISPLYLERKKKVSNYLVQLQDITVRKRAEEKLKTLNKELDNRVHERTNQLKKSEKQYKTLSSELETILDHYPGLAFYKDTNNNFIRINQHVVDYYNSDTAGVKANLTKKDIEGKNLSDLLLKDIAQAYWEDDLEVIKSGTPKLSIEESFNTEQGVIWLNSNKIPYFDENGEIKGIIGFSIDITERKKAQQKLKESEEKYRLITENVDGLISVSDQNMNFEYVNEKAYFNILGRNKEEIIGQSPLNWVHPEDAEKLIETFKMGFEEGKGSLEARIRDKKGIYHWLDIKGKAFIDHDGKKKILTISRDTTHHKQAEQIIIQEREKANLYLNVIDVILVALDKDGTITMINKKGHELLGYDEGELIGKNWFEVCLPPRDRERVYEYFKKLIAGEIELIKFYENPVWAKAGEERLISWSTALFKDENGTITGLLSSGVDITERAIIEQKLTESEASYRHLSKELEVILDHIPGVVVYKDTENNILRVNKFLADAHNLKKTDMENRSSFDFYPRDVAQAYWEDDLEVINSKKPKINIVEPWETDEGKRWVNTSKIPYIDENGNVKGIIAIALDVTERMLAEQKLKESEEKLRKQNVFLNNILESLTHPFYVIDVKDYRIVLANTAAGLEGIEHGTYCYSRTHNTNKPCEAPCVCPLEEVIKTKKTCVVEHIHFDKEGNEKFFDVYGYPILDENGNVVQMIEYGFDVTEAKIAQQELKKSEEKYRHLFDNSPYYIILLDKEGNFIDCNNATVDIYGYSKEDFIDKNFKEMPIIPFELIPTLENKMESLLKGELMSPIEFIPITKDGNLIWINSQASLIKLGNEFFIFIIGQDITERKKAERKIKESEENYRDLANQWRTTFDAMNEAVFLLDLEQNILQCNKASLDILGKEQYKEIIGHTCCEIVHGTDEPVEWCPMVRMIKSRHEESSIAQIGDRWCEISVDPVINEEGTLIGAVHIITDITERRKTEVALRESEERFRNLIEQSVDGIVIVNEDGLIIEWNKSQEQIIGLKREEVLGIPIWDVQFQAYSEREKNLEQYEKFKSMMEDVLKSGEAPWLGKLRDLNIIRADNNKNRIIQQLPFLIKTQKKIMLSSFSRDITEQKLIQEENQEKQATLESIFRASPIGIGMVKNRVLNQVNDRFCNIVGYTQDELLNKSARIVYPSDEEYELVGKIKYDRINKLGIGTVETKFLRKDGKIIDVLVSSVPLDLNDHSVGVTFTTLDITERKKVERELLESEQKFRTIAEQSFMGIIILQDGLFKYFNQRAADINGYSVEEIQNWKPNEFANLIHPEDREFVMEQARKKQGGETDVINRYKYQAIKKSGEIAWFDNYSKTITYKGRSADLIMTEDITDKIKAEQELKESEKKYRHLFESSPYFIGLIDEDGTLVDSNSSISKFLSMRTKEDVIGKNILEILSIVEENKEIIPLLQNIFQEAHSNEPVKSHEFKLYRSTGGFLWLKVEGSTVEINNQKLLQFIVQDITNRKIIEEELKESEQKFRTIAEQSFMGIIISQDNKIKYANKALLNLFEFSEKEILNWSDDDLTNLIHPEDLSFLKEYRKYLRHGETSQKPYFSYRVFTKLGKIKWIDQFSKKIQYKGGPAELVTIIDVTEKKEVEEKLIKLNNMKSELLRRTSHELRTPLVSIKGFSDLLLELHRDKLDNYVIRTIEQIRSGCYRLESLVNDILKTSELESGTVGLKKSKEDLSLLIKICVSDLEGLTKLRNHSINLEISDDLICSFEKKQIYNVITNLLSNAIKYTPISGRIEVKSEITNGFIIISIQDNGIGFTKEEKDQIFKKFGKIERYGQGYDIISEGSGLGLYISKKIVEMHGGGVWLESEGRDRGSTFYFSLPVA